MDARGMSLAAALALLMVLPGLAPAQTPEATEAEEMRALMDTLRREQAELRGRIESAETELDRLKGAAAAPAGMRSEPISVEPFSRMTLAPASNAGPSRLLARNGWYLSLCGGFAAPGRATTDTITYIDWTNGWTVHGAAGYRLTENFRVEIESGAFGWDVDEFSLNGGGVALLAEGSGTATLASLMMNLYLDYPIHITEGVTVVPYIGGGFGGNKAYVDDITNPLVEPAGFVFTGHSKVRLTHQLLAGMSVPITEHLEVFAGYRYLNADQEHIVTDLPNGLRLVVGAMDLEVQMGEFGIRFTF